MHSRGGSAITLIEPPAAGAVSAGSKVTLGPGHPAGGLQGDGVVPAAVASQK